MMQSLREDDVPKEAPSSLASSQSADAEGDGKTKQQLSLERLVAHFVQAKRALASTSYVLRANEIVAIARLSLENIAQSMSTNRFLAATLQQRLENVKAIRIGIRQIDDEGDHDFKSVLRDLDSADARVKDVLQVLKSTTVEASFKPDEEAKCLYDFVDEEGVNNLTKVLHRCIDRTNAELADFVESNKEFDLNIEAIDNGLVESAQYQEQIKSHAPVSSTFHSLESLATEIADLLQSLVHHYDLCVTAIKQTEGGGEAVENVNVDLPEGMGNDGTERTSPAPTLSEEERIEMMQVLDKDAAEVDEVVQEIADFAAQMEAQLDQITGRVSALQAQQVVLIGTAKQLQSMGENIPRYIQASSTFKTRWNQQKNQILDKMEEFESVRDFYEGFLEAYDGLILEIGRRKLLQARKEKIVGEALAKLQKLYEEDLEDRETFKNEQGEYLPSDIWPGLVDPPTQYEIKVVGTATANLPQISKATLQKASHRRRKR